ncbi:actin-histidine N-methyltransferase-like [Sycon ciliatum]|uniref:actin-histidine N-methyltransferase-like n=1 Tax=Sycon ciliatum TaxID=27933 RepID=UPI0020AD7B68|eukprot:scpid54307/ scgid9943/ Histone-lysine N-methyltransferase setd3; SET domain-containing protein 3
MDHSFVFRIVLLLALSSSIWCGHSRIEKWAQSRNAATSAGVEIAHLPDFGWGIRATTDLNAGTVLTSTPLTAVLSLEHAYLFPDFEPIIEGRLNGLGDTDLTALFLAFLHLHYSHQENVSSGDSVASTTLHNVDPLLDWSGYLNSLPRDVGLPVQYTDDLFEDMRGSALVGLCQRRNKAVTKSYRYIQKTLSAEHPGAMAGLSEALFRWGLAIVWSRTHRVRARDPKGQWQVAAVLVPLADIFNMADSEERANVECATNDDSTHFNCSLTQPTKAGEQLFVLYSSPAHRHNGRLLMDYGFSLRRNPWNQLTFILPTDVPQHVSDYTQKQSIWKSMEPWGTGVTNIKPLSDDEIVSFELLAIGRLFNLNKDTVQSVQDMKPRDRYASLLKPAASPAVENAAVRWAKKLLEKARRDYRTTLVEDEHLLDSPHISASKRNVIILRAGEKEIIDRLLQALEHYQQVLAAKKKKRAKKRRDEL